MVQLIRSKWSELFRNLCKLFITLFLIVLLNIWIMLIFYEVLTLSNGPYPGLTAALDTRMSTPPNVSLV